MKCFLILILTTAFGLAMGFNALRNVAAAIISTSIGPVGGIGVDGEGLFNLCPKRNFGAVCVSSQDDRPAYFQSPWQYEDRAYADMKRKLVGYVGRTYDKKAILVQDSDRYLRWIFSVDGSSDLEDMMEFYFTPDDNTIQFRGERQWIDKYRQNEEGPLSDFGANAGKAESIRIGLHLESVPVLRNRKRALLFFESPFDSFGPSTSDMNQSI